MKSDKIFGTLTIFNEECQFTYEDGVLNIALDIGNENIKPLTSGKFNQETITGIIKNGSQFVTFYVGGSNYRTGLSIKYFAKTTLYVAVKFYLIHNRPLNNIKFTAIKLRFDNSKFRKFLGYYEKHQLPKRIAKRQSLKYSTVFNTTAFKNETNIILNGTAINVYPYFALTPSYSAISLHVGFDSVFKTNVFDFGFIYSFFEKFYNLLKFIFYRQNIELGSISLRIKHKIRNKYLFEEIGQCFVPFDSRYEMEESDLNKADDFGFITWNIVYKHIPSLFDLISKDELYLYNIPSNKEEKRYISINSISLDASAFEFEFNKLFGPINLFTDLADRKAVKDKFDDFLKTFNNANQRDIAKKCIQGISNPTLRMKNKKALEDFAFVIKPLAQQFGYQNYVEDISKEFVEKRNAIDHGLKNLIIDNDTANAYLFERILIYSMQLRRVGMDDDEILNSVKLVFELFKHL